MKHTVLALLLLLALVACNLPGTKRNPASDFKVTDEPVAFFQIKLETLRRGLEETAKKSPMIEKINRFEMDPVTRIINLNLTIRYPMDGLFNFDKMPKQGLGDLHELEIAVSLPETKTLAYTRYMGLTFHKFKIDGDEYVNAFEVVAAVTKTILANSDLINYIYNKSEAQISDANARVMLKEILDNNGIVVFHTSRKINFKLDLSQMSSLNAYASDYSNLRLWRFSPTLFQGEEVRFKVIAGEGEPSEKWMKSQQERISEDTRTLLQVREELYQEYSDIENVSIIAQNYLQSLLDNEKIEVKKLARNYQREIQTLVENSVSKARDILSRSNENFSADPEYEYLAYIEHLKSSYRMFVSDLDRRLSIDYNILQGGSLTASKKPLLTKLVSQDIINGGMNFVTDMEYENQTLLSEASLWLLPQLPGIELRGRINLPLEMVLGKMDSSLIDVKVESKMLELDSGVPFSLRLEQNLADNGVLGLDIKSLTLFEGSKKLEFNRRSKNQQFLIDLTKIFLAQSVGDMEFELDDEIDEQQRQAEEIKTILAYIKEFQNLYAKGSNEEQLAKIFLSDLELNPFIVAGKDYVRKKKKILFGDIIQYNEKNKLFELRLDPNIVVDNINNTKHNLQVWGIAPIYSKELDNTFLKLDVGHGVRSKAFIDEQYSMRGEIENSEFAGIYYELGKHRNPVDLMFSLNFDYLESYINLFLADMVKANQTNIKLQAENNPGETFYEISHLKLDITENKEFKLDVSINMAKKSRNWYAPWSRSLSEDSYSLTMLLDLKSKELPIGSNSDLSALRYYEQAISVNPKQVQIKAGKPSLINSALTGLINSAVKLSLNNGTVKKLLMKIADKFLTKMYQSKDQKIIGHEIEKIARLYTTKDDLLIYLNPRLSGPAFDLHLTGDHKDLFKAISVDTKNQALHVAMTASVAMAKTDKKELISIFKDTSNLLKPFLEAKTKEQMQALLKDGQLVGKLLTNSDKSKMSLYNRMLNTMKKYDQVLHNVKIPHADQVMNQRISATGSELIYFASVSLFMHKQIEKLTAQMKKFGFTHQNHYYPSFLEAQDKLLNSIAIPLITTYESKNKIINETIIKNKVSYWTYLFYPDAYFAQSAYKIIQNKK